MSARARAGPKLGCISQMRSRCVALATRRNRSHLEPHWHSDLHSHLHAHVHSHRHLASRPGCTSQVLALKVTHRADCVYAFAHTFAHAFAHTSHMQSHTNGAKHVFTPKHTYVHTYVHSRCRDARRGCTEGVNAPAGKKTYRLHINPHLHTNPRSHLRSPSIHTSNRTRVNTCLHK